MNPLIRRGALGAAVLIMAAPAAAHVTLSEPQASTNTSYKAVLRVSHGCDGQPTTNLRVQIPDGVLSVKPMPKAGWTIDLIKAPPAAGGTAKEIVKEVVWSGSLPDEYYDEFVFQARITDAFSPGSTVYFPTIQECAAKAERWVEVPAGNGDAHALKYPSPALRVVAPAVSAPATFRTGALTVEEPWSRATPGGAKVGGGYMRIVNRGTEPDRLIGGTAAAAGGFELHETTNVDGVARMRPVEGGLVIPPGGAVELKPGGLHVMLTDLNRPLKQGETVAGTLVFEKAGTVAITYQVGGIGAQSAGGGHHHH